MWRRDTGNWLQACGPATVISSETSDFAQIWYKVWSLDSLQCSKLSQSRYRNWNTHQDIKCHLMLLTNGVKAGQTRDIDRGHLLGVHQFVLRWRNIILMWGHWTCRAGNCMRRKWRTILQRRKLLRSLVTMTIITIGLTALSFDTELVGRPRSNRVDDIKEWINVTGFSERKWTIENRSTQHICLLHKSNTQ